MRIRRLAGLVALSTLVAAPVSAAPVSAAPETYVLPNPWQVAAAPARVEVVEPEALETEPSPERAARLSLVVPPLLAATTMVLGSNQGVTSFFAAAAIGATGFGAGHLYAGDEARAIQVAMGGPAIMLGAGLAGHALSQTILPGAGGMGAPVFGLVTAGAAMLGYGAWASRDARTTTLRENDSD